MYNEKLGRKPGIKRRFTYACVAGIVGCTLVAGCRKSPGPQSSDPNAPDPAAANLAPVDPNQPQSDPAAGAYPAQRGVVSQTGSAASRTRVLGQSQTGASYQQSESYDQRQPAPIERAPDPRDYTPPQAGENGGYQAGDENFDQTIDQYAEEAPQPPPPLPVYEQPPAPEPNYLWTPGYWSYASTGYFWVPGAWCAPPYAGALWTPGYWGYVGNRYRFRRGFWGLHIGYYGGIAYGFGYTGHGYEGGYWRGNDFYYNRSVSRVNETVIHNTYVHNVTISNTVVNNRVSYNGPGGVQARPAAYEVVAMRERHAPPQAAQVQIRQQAAGDRQQFFNQNHGRPAVAVAQRPLVADRGVVAPPRQPFAQPGQAQQAGRPAPGAEGRQAQPGQPQRVGEQPRPGQGQQEPPPQRTLNTPRHDQPQNGAAQVAAPNQARERQFERNQPGTPPQPQPAVRQDQGLRPNLSGEPQRGQSIPQPEQRTREIQTPHAQPQPQPQQTRPQFGQPRDTQPSQQRAQPQTQPQIQPGVPQPRQQPQVREQRAPQPQPQMQQRAPQAQPQIHQRAPSQPRVEPQQPRPQPQPGGQPRVEAPRSAPQSSPHQEHSPK